MMVILIGVNLVSDGSTSRRLNLVILQVIGFVIFGVFSLSHASIESEELGIIKQEEQNSNVGVEMEVSSSPTHRTCHCM